MILVDNQRQTRGSKMSEKKMVTRRAAIGLGIVSMVLVAGLVGVFAYFMPIVNDKDNTIARKDSQIASLNSNVTSLQNQVNNLTDNLNLRESTVWVDGGTVNLMDSFPMDSPPTYEENASIAGYVAVQVSNQYEYNATVEVRYSSHGVNYENSIIVGNSGTAVFPVLPSSSISIYIFQTFNEHFILSGPLYATVTITYYY